ncbi:MAG: hypothetical protein WCI57_04130 [Candidatus Berkelbacteria bacterium]
MNEKINKKTTVLFSVPGFGLSTAWQGNAIAAASPVNFIDLWKDYKHVVLTSPYRENQDFSSWSSIVPYLMMSTGKPAITNKVLVDKAISHSLLEKSDMLKHYFQKIKKHNASLHLIGNISKNAENGDLEHLLRIVKIARKNFVSNILIHVIIDDTYPNINLLKNKLDLLETSLQEIGLGEIATVSGQKALLSAKDKLLPIKLFFESKAQRYLTVAQGLSKNKKLAPSSVEPFIVSTNRIAITDFDGIFFFNHISDDISDLLLYFLTDLKIVSFSGKPHFLNLISLFDFPTLYSEYIPAIFKRDLGQTIAGRLGNLGKKHLLICASDRKTILSHYYGAGSDGFEVQAVRDSLDSSEDHNALINEYYKVLKTAIDSDKYDLITLDLRVLANIAKNSFFDQVKAVVAGTDEMLGKISKLQFERNLDIIFISPYGMAEKIKTFSTYEKDQELLPSANPVPLIHISRETKQGSKSFDLIVDEIASTKQDLTLVYQILAQSLGL